MQKNCTTLTISDLPGPRGLPLLGNALQIKPNRIQETIEAWAEKYGCPYRLSLGKQKVVVISDADMIRQALKERPDRFRRFRQLEDLSQEMGINGLFPAEGLDWQRQRRAWMQALNFHQVKPFFSSLTKTTERLKKRWEKAAENGEPIDVQADLMRFTVDVTTEFAFGHATNTLEQDDDVIQRHLGNIFYMLNRRLSIPVPYWRWFKLRVDREFDASLIAVREFASTMIADARERIANNPELAKHPGNLLEALLVARDEDGSTYSDDEIFGNTLVALLAGEDTTANTIAWMMHMLSIHPDTQSKLQSEVDAALGNDLLWSRLEDGARLNFLDAVSSETLRIKPVAPLIFLCTNKDVMLGNLQLPANTNVILALRHLSTSEESYSDANTFKPERWIENSKARIENMAPMPFGGGPRMCPGRNLAQMEIRSVVAMLARNFEIEPYDDREVSEIIAFTMSPKNLRIKFKSRIHSQRNAA